MPLTRPSHGTEPSGICTAEFHLACSHDHLVWREACVRPCLRELRLGKQSHPIVLRNVNYAGIDAVAIVNQQSLRLVAWQDGTDLLDRPRGCGLLGHVPIGDPPGSNITSSLRTTRGVTGTVDRRLDVDVCLHVGAERQCVYAASVRVRLASLKVIMCVTASAPEASAASRDGFGEGQFSLRVTLT